MTQVNTPTISPDAGGYPMPQEVTLSDSTPGASIYYSTDGVDPSSWNLVYSSPATYIESSCVYNNKLYIGTNNFGIIYYYDGLTWSTAWDAPGNHVDALCVYNNKLYIGTESFGKIYAYNGSTWDLSYTPPSFNSTYSLCVYNNKLYACGSGSVIYVYDGSSWSVSYTSGVSVIRSLAVYNNKLYAGGNGTQGVIYEYNGSTWSTSYSNAAMTVYALCAYDNKLYAAGSTNSLVYIYDGSTWGSTSVGSSIISLYVYGNKLYAGQGPSGIIYYYDGSAWSTAWDSAEFMMNTFCEYNNDLFVGTASAGRVYKLGAGANLYTAPFNITQACTVKAKAIKEGYSDSAVASNVYTQNICDTPTISPNAGNYVMPQQITLGCTTVGASVYYTTNGDTPTSGSTLYTVPFNITQACTVKAIAIKTNYNDSPAVSRVYTNNICDTPTISPNAGNYVMPQQITLGCTTVGASVYYTTNGDTPTSGSTLYTVPFNITQACTVKAIAIKSTWIDSAVASNVYTQNACDTPTISPDEGGYSMPQEITLGCTTNGVSIYYTTNGDTPTSGSTLYTIPFNITQACTVKAIAILSGYIDSAVASNVYTQNICATPLISPTSGGYPMPQEVTISCSTNGVSIYYTTNGDTPTSGSTLYTLPFSITQACTLKSIAIKTGYNNSAVASRVYTHNVCATPYVYPDEGGHAMPFYVELGCYTYEASIYYTLNGDTPTSESTLYTDEFLITQACTLKAIAIKTNYNDSDIVSRVYTQNICATPIISPVAGNYQMPQEITLSCITTEASIYYTTNGATPTSGSTLYTIPFDITQACTVKAIAIKDDYNNSVVASTAYAYPICPTPTSTPLGGSFSTEQTIILYDEDPNVIIYYTLDGSDPSIESLVYMNPFIVDISILIKAISVKEDYFQSEVYSAEFIITGAEKLYSIRALTSFSGEDMATVVWAKPENAILDKTIYYYAIAPIGEQPTNWIILGLHNDLKTINVGSSLGIFYCVTIFELVPETIYKVYVTARNYRVMPPLTFESYIEVTPSSLYSGEPNTERVMRGLDSKFTRKEDSILVKLMSVVGYHLRDFFREIQDNGFPQLDISSSTGSFLDEWGLLFNIKRYPNETDSEYSARIIKFFLIEKTTINGLKKALSFLAVDGKVEIIETLNDQRRCYFGSYSIPRSFFTWDPYLVSPPAYYGMRLSTNEADAFKFIVKFKPLFSNTLPTSEQILFAAYEIISMFKLQGTVGTVELQP
jgi:ribosomal protein L33